LQLKNSVIQTAPSVVLSFSSYRRYKFQQLVYPLCSAAFAMCPLATQICKGVRPLCHVNCVQLVYVTNVPISITVQGAQWIIVILFPWLVYLTEMCTWAHCQTFAW